MTQSLRSIFKVIDLWDKLLINPEQDELGILYSLNHYLYSLFLENLFSSVGQQFREDKS